MTSLNLLGKRSGFSGHPSNPLAPGWARRGPGGDAAYPGYLCLAMPLGVLLPPSNSQPRHVSQFTKGPLGTGPRHSGAAGASTPRSPPQHGGAPSAPCRRRAGAGRRADNGGRPRAGAGPCFPDACVWPRGGGGGFLVSGGSRAEVSGGGGGGRSGREAKGRQGRPPRESMLR